MIIREFHGSEGFPGGARIKNPPTMQRSWEIQSFFPGSKIPWVRAQQPTPVFYSLENPMDGGPWDSHKEPTRLRRLSTHTHGFEEQKFFCNQVQRSEKRSLLLMVMLKWYFWEQKMNSMLKSNLGWTLFYFWKLILKMKTRSEKRK